MAKAASSTASASRAKSAAGTQKTPERPSRCPLPTTIRALQTWAHDCHGLELSQRFFNELLGIGLFDHIVEQLQHGIEVPLFGLCTFKSRKVAARIVRNPRTGEQLRLPGYMAVSMHTSETLRRTVDPTLQKMREKRAEERQAGITTRAKPGPKPQRAIAAGSAKGSQAAGKGGARTPASAQPAGTTTGSTGSKGKGGKQPAMPPSTTGRGAGAKARTGASA